MTSDLRPVGLRARVDRHDRVRWGPVWAGAVTTVATYLVLEMALLALGSLDTDRGGDLPDGALLSVAAAAIAFLLGGIVAGAASAEHDASDGILHGLATWGLGITLFLLLVLLGGGLAWGSLGHSANWLRQVGGAEESEATEESTEERTGAATLMLGATAAAAALGGLAGSRLRHADDTATSGLREVDQRSVSTQS